VRENTSSTELRCRHLQRGSKSEFQANGWQPLDGPNLRRINEVRGGGCSTWDIDVAQARGSLHQASLSFFRWQLGKGTLLIPILAVDPLESIQA
jgi:hypothetical protein